MPGRVETLGGVGTGTHPGLRVRLWLPPGYDRGALRYRTLYMMDGQFAFAADSEGNNFGADRRIAKLAAAGRIPPAIIVAVDNSGNARFRQYLPHAIYERSSGSLREALDRELAGQRLVSAQFLRFLADELKPAIDLRYRTRPGRADTAIAGASMAGLIAAAALVEEQQAFGRAACISPQWPIYDRSMVDHPQLLPLWPAYFAGLGAPAGRRLWLDHGTEMIDAGMAPHQAGIVRRLEELGWRRGRDFHAQVYRGAGHAFANTAVQMDDVLSWLLS